VWGQFARRRGHAFVRAIATEGAAAPAPLSASAPAPGAKELFDWAEYRDPALFDPRQTFVNHDPTYASQLHTVREGETDVEGHHAQQQAPVTGLKARRPHSGSYKTQPPLLEIIATALPRDLKSAVIRFRLEGSAAAGRYTIKYQPEDDCGGGFCEARAVKEISFSND
jgi:hypothetical protein